MNNVVRRFEVAPLTEVIRKEAAKQSEERAKMPIENKPCRSLDIDRTTIRGPQLPGERSSDANPQQWDAVSRRTATPKRVLVVDNDRLIATTLTVILRNAGHEVCACYDELGALSHCESFRPDLMITDVVMPGMNGIQMAIQVRQRYPACKILLFSGQAGSINLIEEARRNGYDFDILEKAIHPDVLLQKIAN